MTHRDRFSGTPLRAISRFVHQNAQTPPSPLVGEGGWGDEGSVPDESQDYAAASASRSLPSSIPSGAAPSICTTSSITVRGTPITS